MTKLQNISKWIYGAGVAALCAVVVWYAVCVQLAGGSALALLWYFALAAVLVILPGLCLAEFLLPALTGAARACCAFALGVFFLFCNALAAGVCGIPAALCAVPLAVAVWQLVRLVRRVQTAHKQTACKTASANLSPVQRLRQGCARAWATVWGLAPNTPRADKLVIGILLLCGAGALFVYSCSGVLAFAHAQAAGNMVYHQDMMWSVGNGAAVQFGLPLRDIRAAGGFLYYHYLADALPGFLAFAGNLLPYDAACYYNYPLLLCFLVCAAYAAARAYGASPHCAAMLPAAVLFLQGWQSPATLEVLRNMNGVPAATLLACTMLVLVFSVNSGDAKQGIALSPRYLTAFAAVTTVLLLSKNLYAILILCAVLAAAAVGSILRRKLWKTPLCLAAVGFAVFGLCWGLLFRHAINNLVQEFWITPATLLRSLLIWLPAGAGLYFVSLVGSLRRFGTLPFARLVANAAALGGLLAYTIFHHYSSSQTYFVLAAMLFLWFCVLDVLPLLRTQRWLRAVAVGLAVVSLAATGISLLPVAQKGVQVALRCAGLRPAYPTIEETVTPGDEEAARWLRTHMTMDDVFATNRNAKYADAGEGTWHYYTAMSGRQAFVESWRYAMDYGYDYHALRYNLEQVSDVIFAQESAQAAFALAKEHEIDYLLISKPLRSTPLSGAEPVFENDAVWIYAVE